MKETHLVAIDTETGGLVPGYHALLQLAAIPTWAAKPFNIFIWPDNHEIDPESLPVSGYRPDLWRERGAVCLSQALKEFEEWLKQAPVEPWKLTPLAHNAGFDRGFIDAGFQLLGRRSPLGHRWRCSQAAMGFLMDAEILPVGTTSLDALAGLCGLHRDPDEPHDALKDAWACLCGYCWLRTRPKDLAAQATTQGPN